MREYNNQDMKTNEAELDPCIAAEIRMKKALFTQRTRRSLLILFLITASLILIAVLLLFLLSKTPNKTATLPPSELRESRPEDSEISSPFSTTSNIPFETLVSSETTDGEQWSSPEVLDDGGEHNNEFMESDENTTVQENEVDTDDLETETTPKVETDTVEISPAPIYSTSNSEFIEMSSSLPETTTSEMEPTTAEETLPPSSPTDEELKDCKSLYAQGKVESGIYQISLPKIGKFEVLCDMKTDGGGWTVIQKREDGKVYFANRTWSEYANGFGDLKNSFWLGLDKIHALVAKDGGRPVTLRIELRGDFCEDKAGCSKQPNGYWWGEWDFQIGDASQKYTLSISSAVVGNLSERSTSDRFYYMNNGKPFTTIDRDNDKFQGNCAQFRDFGGWWHNDCGYVALNGRYGDRTSKMRNMFWFYGSGTRPYVNYHIKPRQTEMKIRSKS